MSVWNKTALTCWYYGGLTKRVCVVLFTEHKAALMCVSSSRQAAWLTHQRFCISRMNTPRQPVDICLRKRVFPTHFELFSYSLWLRFYCHIHAFWWPQITSQYLLHFLPCTSQHTCSHLSELSALLVWPVVIYILNATYIYSSALKQPLKL